MKKFILAAGLSLALATAAYAVVVPTDTNNRAWPFPIPMTSGGLTSVSKSIAATKVAIFTGAGQVYSVTCSETGGVAAYLQMFNKLTADVTVGTTQPELSQKFAANAVATAAGGNFTPPGAMGMYFSTGLMVAATTTRANAVAGALDCDFLIKQ